MMGYPSCGLGLFCTLTPRERRSPDRHDDGNWLCFSAALWVGNSAYLTFLPALTAQNIPPQIGFVSHESRDWSIGMMEYWNSGNTGISRPATSWVCFAHSTFRRSRPTCDDRPFSRCPNPPTFGFVSHNRPRPWPLPSSKLGLFRMFRPPVPAGLPEIGFVLHNWPGQAEDGRPRGRHPAADLPAIRNPQARHWVFFARTAFGRV